MHIHNVSSYMSICIAEGQIYISLCNSFPTSPFIKCHVVSCVQIIE